MLPIRHRQKIATPPSPPPLLRDEQGGKPNLRRAFILNEDWSQTQATSPPPPPLPLPFFLLFVFPTPPRLTPPHPPDLLCSLSLPDVVKLPRSDEPGVGGLAGGLRCSRVPTCSGRCSDASPALGRLEIPPPRSPTDTICARMIVWVGSCDIFKMRPSVCRVEGARRQPPSPPPPPEQVEAPFVCGQLREKGAA